jgi:type VII secretion-associated serine protease mycosin
MQQQRQPRPSTLQRFYAAVVAGLLAGAGVAIIPSAIEPADAAQSGCRQPPPPADPISDLPWAQHWFAPERLWPLSTGDGVVVAVVDTGVDTEHPQLADGQVGAGTDLLPEPAGAHVDCDSHGTAVASIIAGSRVEGVGFTGLAPGVEVLPLRVVEQGVDSASPDRSPPVDPDTFADAIDWAAGHGARVINASIVFYYDHPAIEAAVRRAVDRGVLVVAAVGNQHETTGRPDTPFPAAYPGVVGVGAVGYDRAVAGEPVLALTSYVGRYVDLVAPGHQITAAAAVAGHQLWSGSSFAAPFVSAAAALLMAAEPELTAAEVAARLYATADTGPGQRSWSGHGVVNPYRALTERVVDGAPVAADPPPETAVDPVAAARASRWQRAASVAGLVAVGAAAVLALAAAGTAVWRRGRQRRWRPARRSDPAPPGTAAGDPERVFFTVPTVRGRG